MARWLYWVPSIGETYDETEEVDREVEAARADHAAVIAAEHFHGECDGWECKWPLTFHLREVLRNGDVGPEHIFEVDRDMVPEFSVRRRREPKAVSHG